MSSALADAIVAAAKRDGILAFVIDGRPNGNGAPAQGGVDPTQFNQLNAAYEQAKAALGQVTSERDQLNQGLREMEAKARHFEGIASQGGGAPAAPGAAQPVAIAAFETLGIETLGLDEKMTKSLKTTRGWDTIGKLRTALLEGKLKSEGKLAKDDIIGVAEKLLGKVPPAGVPMAAAAPQTSNGASDTPAGHKDRSWVERLQAARRKEQKKRQIEAKLDQLRRGAFVGADGKGLSPADAGKVTDVESKVLEVTNAQLTAILWACGFEFNPQTGFPSIDETLTKVGLVQFVEAAPITEQPQGAPQTPAPQQQVQPQAAPQTQMQPPPQPMPQPQMAPPPPMQGYAPQPPYAQPPQGMPPQAPYGQHQPQTFQGYAPQPPQFTSTAPPQGYAPQPGFQQHPGYAPQPPQGYAQPPYNPGAPGAPPQMTPGFPG